MASYILKEGLVMRRSRDAMLKRTFTPRLALSDGNVDDEPQAESSQSQFQLQLFASASVFGQRLESQTRCHSLKRLLWRRENVTLKATHVPFSNTGAPMWARVNELIESGSYEDLSLLQRLKSQQDLKASINKRARARAKRREARMDIGEQAQLSIADAVGDGSLPPLALLDNATIEKHMANAWGYSDAEKQLTLASTLNCLSPWCATQRVLPEFGARVEHSAVTHPVSAENVATFVNETPGKCGGVRSRFEFLGSHLCGTACAKKKATLEWHSRLDKARPCQAFLRAPPQWLRITNP